MIGIRDHVLPSLHGLHRSRISSVNLTAPITKRLDSIYLRLQAPTNLQRSQLRTFRLRHCLISCTYAGVYFFVDGLEIEIVKANAKSLFY